MGSPLPVARGRQIYLIDNGGAERAQEVLVPWVEKGVLQLISMTRPHRQLENQFGVCRSSAERGRLELQNVILFLRALLALISSRQVASCFSDPKRRSIGMLSGSHLRLSSGMRTPASVDLMIRIEPVIWLP